MGQRGYGSEVITIGLKASAQLQQRGVCGQLLVIGVHADLL
jgi:hypothetical protein